jgi:hypothetical protein
MQQISPFLIASHFCTISAASTIIQPIDSSRVSNDRSETFAGVLSAPVRPHGFGFDASAVEDFDVPGQPGVNVLIRGVTVCR